MHVRPLGHDERFAHFLQRVRHGQAVLLEGLHRVMDTACDQIRVAAADSRDGETGPGCCWQVEGEGRDTAAEASKPDS